MDSIFDASWKRWTLIKSISIPFKSHLVLINPFRARKPSFCGNLCFSFVLISSIHPICVTWSTTGIHDWSESQVINTFGPQSWRYSPPKFQMWRSRELRAKYSEPKAWRREWDDLIINWMTSTHCKGGAVSRIRVNQNMRSIEAFESFWNGSEGGVNWAHVRGGYLTKSWMEWEDNWDLFPPISWQWRPTKSGLELFTV